MKGYILRRLLLIIPTLFIILTVNFFLVQLAPGGPVEQFIARMEGQGDAFMEQLSGSADAPAADGEGLFSASRGLPPEALAAIERLYGFDRPLHERYLSMILRYLRFDFGDSLFRGGSVMELVAERLPISISLGLWSTLVIYLVSIPLGMARAVRRGSRFDVCSGLAVTALNAIPAFLLAMLLIVVFAGGSYLQIFPLRGLHSPGFAQMDFWTAAADYLHHITLPVLSLSLGGFAGLTLLTRNCFLEELGRAYVDTARAKGLTERAVLCRHVFRNAMLVVIAGLPGTFLRMLFAGSILIETVFSLDGLGLLGFEAALQRDYPVMFGTLYIFTLMGLVCSLLGDLTAVLTDPRIDFEKRGA
ncbi:MAG: microcin C ABC transporter permease YejB [Desulfovibrionaceae bacterium]|nr:microcin C ABC transporter permease YejB [Desulfovibrionaceae bacterium]